MNNKIINILMKEVNKAIKHNESPISAVITLNDKIISKAHNKRNKSNFTIDHAEIIAIKKANRKIKNWRLNKCSLYVTMEPCEMCKNVIKESRISNVYYLLDRYDTKKQYNKVVISKIDDNEFCEVAKNYKNIVQKFWQNKR